MNFTQFFNLQFNDEFMRQIAALDRETLGRPVRVLGAEEARCFMFLVELFDESQIAQCQTLMRELLDVHDYSVSGSSQQDEHCYLNLNNVYPERARSFIDRVRNEVATKDQLEKT